MAKPIFYFVEPSKVRTYHITLIEGYLAAILGSDAVGAAYNVLFYACNSLFENISEPIRRKLSYHSIPVIDQDKHYVVRKSLLEFWVVLRFMLRLRRGDALFISCLMPTALLLIEVANRLLRRRNVFVVIHGEIEAGFSGEKPHWRSIGFWAIRWLKVRRKDSLIDIVVIDDFIKTALLARFPDRFTARSLYVAHHPITPTKLMDITPAHPLTVCFIGYRSAAKGFEAFRNAAVAHPSLRFVAIGDGKVENVCTGDALPIAGGHAFHRAIAGSALALFPYNAAYDCSLSAALLDALSTGLYIVASGRASFVSLANELGPDFVTIFRSPAELDALLETPGWIEARRQCREQRLAQLAASKYGLASVGDDFAKIVVAAMGGEEPV